MAAQLAQIEEAAASHPAGLILTPLNHPAVAERLGRLIDGGCPVVALNSDIDGCARLAYVGCHYARSGRTAAQLLGLITRGTGRLLVVTGSLKVMGHNQRVYGFSRVLAAEFPGMVIEDVVENNDDDACSFEEVSRALAAHPAIDSLYFCAGGVAGGVRAALASGPKTIVTCDLTPEIRRLLEEGAVQATVGQQPYRQGADAMKTLLARLLFQTVPAAPCLYMEDEIKVKYNL